MLILFLHLVVWYIYVMVDGQLGTKDTISYNVPTLVSFFDENRFEVYKVSYGDEFTVVLTCK